MPTYPEVRSYLQQSPYIINTLTNSFVGYAAD
jgi:hypothetical protein